MSLVTPSDIRAQTGAPVSLISDADIQSIIDETELKLESVWGIKFTPTTTIEIKTADWKDKIIVDEYFPLTVYELRNGSTVMDLDNLYVHSDTGIIEIYGDTIGGQYSSRFSGWDIDVKLKYLYGAVEKDTTVQTTTGGAILAGTAVSVTVTDTTGFIAGDYIFIEDLNRKREVGLITTIDDGTTMTITSLVYPYESGALITKSKANEIFRQLSLYESSLAVAINAIGSTYTIATGYTYPEYSVQKGVPYTHWLNAFDRNIKARDGVKIRVKALLGSMV